MCYNDFPRTKTLYPKVLKELKNCRAKKFTHVYTSYLFRICSWCIAKDILEIFFFLTGILYTQLFQFTSKTIIKVQKDTSYSTIDDNIEYMYTCSHYNNNNHFNTLLLHKVDSSVLIMSLQCKYFTSKLLRKPMSTNTWLAFQTKVSCKDLKARALNEEYEA